MPQGLDPSRAYGGPLELLPEQPPLGDCSQETLLDLPADGVFILVSSNNTQDLRVVDIRDLKDIHEVNAYVHPELNQGPEPAHVHDTTITDERVYISYWTNGVVILDKHKLEAGGTPEEVILNPPDSINPADFAVHHSFPTTGEDFLFVEDEINLESGFSQLCLFDIRDLDRPR